VGATRRACRPPYCVINLETDIWRPYAIAKSSCEPSYLAVCRDVWIAEIPDIDSSTYRTPGSGGGVVRSDTETGLDRNERPQNPSGANLVKRRIGPKAIMACTTQWAVGRIGLLL
jgi:hypothetical protein